MIQYEHSPYVNLLEDELMHYGVKGMHWGIRRYQPYPDGSEGKFIGKKQAKKMIKTINENTGQRDDRSYYLSKSKRAAEKYRIKADKASAKGKQKKMLKYQNKMNQQLADAKEHEKGIKEIDKYRDQILNTLKDKYDIKKDIGDGVYDPSEWYKLGNAKKQDPAAKALSEAIAKNTAEGGNMAEELAKAKKDFDAGKNDGYGVDLKTGKVDVEKKSGNSTKLEFKSDDPRYPDYQEAKAKVGNNREITFSKWGSDGVDDSTVHNVVSSIKKDFGSIEKQLKEQAAKEVYDKYEPMRIGFTKNKDGKYEEKTFSRDEFKKNLKIQNISILKDGDIEINMWEDSSRGPMGGHSFDVEYDPKTKKIYGTSVNG